MIGAAVLAAGRSGAGFREAFGVKHKCFVDIAGRPMVRWVLDAVSGAPQVGRVVVVGPTELARHLRAEEEMVTADSGEITDSLRLALEAFTEDERVLLVWSDIPLATSSAVGRFVERCLAVSADVCFPIITFEKLNARLPNLRKTWYSLRDGTFTKGNAVVTRRSFLTGRESRVRALFNTRKRMRWARLIGPSFAQAITRHAISSGHVEAALSRFMAGSIRAVAAEPEIIADVDETSDVELMQRVILRRTSRREGIGLQRLSHPPMGRASV